MKRAKIILIAIVILAFLGGIQAFKGNRYGAFPLYQFTSWMTIVGDSGEIVTYQRQIGEPSFCTFAGVFATIDFSHPPVTTYTSTFRIPFDPTYVTLTNTTHRLTKTISYIRCTTTITNTTLNF